MIKNIVIAVLVVVIVVLGVGMFVGGQSNLGAAGTEHYNYESFYSGLLGNNVTIGGGILTVTSTTSAVTLTASQLESANVISIADTAGSVALALTLPATSTMTSLLRTAGDSRTWYVQNLHSNAATTTTITAGTGIDLQGITANDDVINGAVTGKLTCYRQASTDVVCVVNEYVVAD